MNPDIIYPNQEINPTYGSIDQELPEVELKEGKSNGQQTPSEKREYVRRQEGRKTAKNNQARPSHKKVVKR